MLLLHQACLVISLLLPDPLPSDGRFNAYSPFLSRHLRISRAPLHLLRPTSLPSLSMFSEARTIFPRLTVSSNDCRATSLQFTAFMCSIRFFNSSGTDTVTFRHLEAPLTETYL